MGQDKQHERRMRRAEAWLCGREVNFLTCSNTRAKCSLSMNSTLRGCCRDECRAAAQDFEG